MGSFDKERLECGLIGIWDPAEPTATRPLLLSTPKDWYTYGFDQVKNVTELFDSSGNIAATCDYSPFGEITVATGTAAAPNPIRFSSEVYDSALGLVQYNYRPYNPLDGRFINSDPIEEEGGLNLYGIVSNNIVDKWDYLGLRGSDSGNSKENCGKCGPEIDAGLIATMADVKRRFDASSPAQKKQHCSSMSLAKTWDVFFPDPPKGCGSGKCDETVMVGGKCYTNGKSTISSSGGYQVCAIFGG